MTKKVLIIGYTVVIIILIALVLYDMNSGTSGFFTL